MHSTCRYYSLTAKLISLKIEGNGKGCHYSPQIISIYSAKSQFMSAVGRLNYERQVEVINAGYVLILQQKESIIFSTQDRSQIMHHFVANN